MTGKHRLLRQLVLIYTAVNPPPPIVVQPESRDRKITNMCPNKIQLPFLQFFMLLPCGTTQSSLVQRAAL